MYMKRAFRIIAAALLVGAVTFWAAAGANHGWTKTRVPQRVSDPVTGLEGVQWQDQFVPGVDFLAVAALGSGILGVISLFVGKKLK
jgi:hypothetical protein